MKRGCGSPYKDSLKYVGSNRRIGLHSRHSSRTRQLDFRIRQESYPADCTVRRGRTAGEVKNSRAVGRLLKTCIIPIEYLKYMIRRFGENVKKFPAR